MLVSSPFLAPFPSLEVSAWLLLVPFVKHATGFIGEGWMPDAGRGSAKFTEMNQLNMWSVSETE